VSLNKTVETRGQTRDEHKRNAEVVTGIQTTGTKSYENSGKESGYQLQVNPLTPELNPSAHRCLPRFFTGDFAS
jgi:predicted chitinase